MSITMRIEELSGKPFKSIVNMAQLLGEPVGSSHSYHADEVVEDNSDSVQGEITLIHGGRRVLLRAELTVNVNLTCSRCLNDFIYPANFLSEIASEPSDEGRRASLILRGVRPPWVELLGEISRKARTAYVDLDEVDRGALVDAAARDFLSRPSSA